MYSAGLLATLELRTRAVVLTEQERIPMVIFVFLGRAQTPAPECASLEQHMPV